jgi:hypothetical protein
MVMGDQESETRSPSDAETHQVLPASHPSGEIPANMPSVDQVEPKLQPVPADEASEPVEKVRPERAETQAENPVPQGAAAESQPVTTTEVPEIRSKIAESSDALPPRQVPAHQVADALVLADSRSHTRRSFAVAALAAGAGYAFYHWIPRSAEDMAQPELLRRTLQANAALSRAVFDERALAPTYSLSKAETLRVNGVYGLKRTLIPDSWRLQLVGMRGAEQHARFSSDVTAWEYRYADVEDHEDQGHDTKVAPSQDTAQKMAPLPMMDAAKRQQQRTVRMPRGQEEAGRSRSTLASGTSGLLLTIDDITKLPRREMVTQFKCIEGWGQIVHWAGVRMADFLELYPPKLIDGREPGYVYMETPNGDYYTGYDMHVMRHPQTLLVTEMMGAPLTQFHGAPLRLHMPTKYGYKQIKRIGLISYSNEKPDDYWTKLGYDWYAGL